MGWILMNHRALLIPLLLLLVAAGPARQDRLYGVAVRKNVMIAMRDGAWLAADVYLPARDGEPVPGQWPTLLIRTPYNKDGSSNEARWFASRGYAFVAND